MGSVDCGRGWDSRKGGHSVWEPAASCTFSLFGLWGAVAPMAGQLGQGLGHLGGLPPPPVTQSRDSMVKETEVD